MSIKLFGWAIGKESITKVEDPVKPAFTLPTEANDDGAITITQGAYYGTYVDLEGSVRNELELITRYREMSMHPECEAAIDEICNESINRDPDGKIVSIVLDDLKQPDSIKKRIIEEFDNILRMVNFSNLADDIFRRWYIDGRIYYHVIVNEKQPKLGIQELRFVDPRKIRKVREILKDVDPKTGAEIIKATNEYYIYNDRTTGAQTFTAQVNQGLRIAPDAILNVNSGMMDAKNVMVIGYLHKAIKPLNQVRMVEDAVVIYRLSRAPERRIFYIDVGNLPKGKAEQYMRDIMTKYRNKLVYDANTGELRDERKHLSMLEDFWLPRREGGKGTEITTLPGGQNLGQMEDVLYFEQKLFQALGVPVSRLQPQNGGLAGMGRTTEITRDEIKFSKFISKLRNKFAQLFDHALKTQLTLKGICTAEEWHEFREFINYDWQKENNFLELMEADLLRERLTLLAVVDPYIGRFFSEAWVKREVLRQDEEEIEDMKKEMEEEQSQGIGMPIPREGEQVPGQDPNQPMQGAPGVPGGGQQGIDNTGTDSMTPELDDSLEKFGKK